MNSIGIIAGENRPARHSEPSICVAPEVWLVCTLGQAPIAQLDRALPSEGRGRTFESCWVRHLPFPLPAKNGSKSTQGVYLSFLTAHVHDKQIRHFPVSPFPPFPKKTRRFQPFRFSMHATCTKPNFFLPTSNPTIKSRRQNETKINPFPQKEHIKNHSSECKQK